MDGKGLRARRVAAGISGALLSLKSGISRSRLSDVERGYVELNAEESSRIEKALDGLIEARQKVEQVAAQVGWPMLGL